MGPLLIAVRDISKGLPQGGVISPLLWLMYFNTVPQRLRAERQRTGMPLEDFTDVLYADDVTSVIKADTLEELTRRARLTMSIMQDIMRQIGLRINEQKTQNLLLDPTVLPRGSFRRQVGTTFPSTRTRRAQQYRQAAACDRTILEFDPWEDEPEEPWQRLRRNFPVPLTDTIRVLGMILDEYMTLDDHFTSLLTRAQIRQAILRRVGTAN